MTPRSLAPLLLLLIGCGNNHLTISSVPLVHRATAAACPTDRPAYNCTGGPVGAPATCHSDSECTSGVNGRCVGNGHDGCNCSYDTCASDADCASGSLCDCRDTWHYGANGPNQCVPSDCRIDADCGAGGYCSPSLDPTCGAFSGVTLWHCHTPADECVNDSDCAGRDAGSGFGPAFCGWRPEAGHWACALTTCAG